MAWCCSGNISLIWMVLLDCIIVAGSQNTCTDINVFPNLVHGMYLAGSEFQTHSNTMLLVCVKECQLRKRCVSFNFEVATGNCELNEKVQANSSSNITDSPDSVYSDISGWPGNLVGACASHTCPEDSKCRETEPGQHDCVVESCVDPPHVDNTQIMTSSRFTEVGAAVPYQCDPPNIPAGEITCLPNGTWGGNFTCMRLRNCEDLRACNASYEDGEYWIYIHDSDYSLVKVYCHDMEGVPDDYVTLEGSTYSDFLNLSSDQICGTTWSVPYCGKTVFEKVRLWPLRNLLRMDEYTFAASNCEHSPLGWAGDCRLCPMEPVQGSFKIDLSGTGLKVAETVTWISHTGSWDPIWNRTNSGTVITGECVGGCDFCMPAVVTEMLLPVELDLTYDFDLSRAIFPKCSPPRP